MALKLGLLDLGTRKQNFGSIYKARFRRRTFHVPNLMLMT